MRFEKDGETLLSAVGCRLSAGEGVRLSDFRLAWYLEMYSLHTASHIKVGDFSTPLRCARNDIGEFG